MGANPFARAIYFIKEKFMTAVLIPCYNEVLTIENVIKDFRKEMPHAEIYVYDNNSTDGTSDIVTKLQKKDKKLHLKHEYKQGKGNVVRSMLRDIDADCYIVVDGDDTYPAKFGPELERLVLSGEADMAVGDRLSGAYFEENKRAFHNFGNILVKNLINILFKANLHDIMTGARAFSKEFGKSYAILCKGFEIETDMTIFALDNNFRIIEREIEYRDRPEGSESKLNTYFDGAKVLMTIGRLFRDVKPFAFFGIISLILFIISMCFFIPICFDYLATGVVLKFPTLIVTATIMIASLMTFFCGVILSVLKRYHRADFERYLNGL